MGDVAAPGEGGALEDVFPAPPPGALDDSDEDSPPPSECESDDDHDDPDEDEDDDEEEVLVKPGSLLPPRPGTAAARAFASDDGGLLGAPRAVAGSPEPAADDDGAAGELAICDNWLVLLLVVGAGRGWAQARQREAGRQFPHHHARMHNPLPCHRPPPPTFFPHPRLTVPTT